MRVWKIILLIMIALIVLVGGIGFFLRSKTKSDLNNLPQFIQRDFIDLDKIYSISKFRSGSGHDFSRGTGETCRSMKHYFNVQETKEKFVQWDKNNGLPPPDGKTDIAIYSPVDGKIMSAEEEQTPIGRQIYIRPDSAPGYTVRLFHVYLNDGIGKGTKVKAGEKIGVIGAYQNTDIAITAGRFGGPFISYFQLVPDDIFAKYQARGVESRDELIITKEYRDAHPLQCNGEQFANNHDSVGSSDNFVYLSGWQDPNQLNTGN